MLTVENAVLVIVDVQGKLAQIMWEREKLFKNLGVLIQGVQVMKVPIIWLEQNPKGLGATVPEVTRYLNDLAPIAKFVFSCCREPKFMEALDGINRRQVLLAGIETHICVFQTARDLIERGYHAQVAADATSSRTQTNWQVGLERIRYVGGEVTSVESALFELAMEGQGEAFKQLVRIVK